MRKRLLFVLTCFFISMGLAIAQNKQVSGTVVDEQGVPIIGASVTANNAAVGAATDINGKFSFSVPQDVTVLAVKYIGYKAVEVAAGTGVQVILSPDNTMLDEVIVVAYGTAKKSSFTGAAAQVSGERISAKNSTEITKALQGEVAGVEVFNVNGQPGSNAKIRIRGLGSVNASSAPLYVVDGIPYGANISGINPNDVESTTILKDATAAALYGSRAANGVVLITTKKGHNGKTRVTAEVKYGFNTRMIPLYETIDNPERFVELTWEGLKNGYQYRPYLGGPYDEATSKEYASEDLFNYDYGGIYEGYNIWNTAGVDLIDPATGKIVSSAQRKFTPEKWEDYIFRTGQKTEADVSISGGSGKTTYFTSLGFLKDEGYYIGSDFQRFSGRSNINTDLNSWLKHTVNVGYSHMTQNSPGQTDNMNNGFQFVNYMPSLFPVFQRDEDGNKIPDEVIGGDLYDYGIDVDYGRPYASNINPAGAIQLDKNKRTYNQFVGNTSFEARFLTDFKFDVNLGVQYVNIKRDDLTNPYYGDAEGLGRIYKYDTSVLSVNSTQKLSYNKTFNVHHLDAFVAHESSVDEASYMRGQKSLLVRPDNTEWSNAVVMGNMDSDTYGYSIESYFGQVRYDYDEKYFFNASVRADGSSRFKADNRWGTFGSVGAAWMLTKEDFLKDVKWLKELKVKASWGYLGNQDLAMYTVADYYPYLDLYTITNLNDKPSFSFSYKGNSELTWEKSSMTNIGLETNINDVLEVELDYFNKTTNDLLFYKQVAPSLGYALYPVNDGQLRTSGLEFTFLAHAVNTNDLKVDLRLNGGSYRNKMLKMPLDETTGKPKSIEQQGSYGWVEGRSTKDFYLREYAGVDLETGIALYNQYYNVKPDGSKEAIADMELYKSKNQIHTLEVETTDNYANATKKFVGKSSIPTVAGGFGFDIDYKGITLSSTFTYALGGYALDVVYAGLMADNTPGSANWHKDIEKRWQKPGDVTDVPLLTAGYDTYNSTVGSDRFLTSRSYLNLANIRLGYNLPKSVLSKLKISGLSVYVSGDNLFLLSARNGFVAMSSVDGGSSANTDDGEQEARSRYLPLSTIMGGIKVEF